MWFQLQGDSKYIHTKAEREFAFISEVSWCAVAGLHAYFVVDLSTGISAEQVAHWYYCVEYYLSWLVLLSIGLISHSNGKNQRDEEEKEERENEVIIAVTRTTTTMMIMEIVTLLIWIMMKSMIQIRTRKTTVSTSSSRLLSFFPFLCTWLNAVNRKIPMTSFPSKPKERVERKPWFLTMLLWITGWLSNKKSLPPSHKIFTKCAAALRGTALEK